MNCDEYSFGQNWIIVFIFRVVLYQSLNELSNAVYWHNLLGRIALSAAGPGVKTNARLAQEQHL